MEEKHVRSPEAEGNNKSQTQDTAGDIFYASRLRQDEAYVYVCWYEMRRISEMRAICPFTRDNAHEWSAAKQLG